MKAVKGYYKRHVSEWPQRSAGIGPKIGSGIIQCHGD